MVMKVNSMGASGLSGRKVLRAMLNKGRTPGISVNGIRIHDTLTDIAQQGIIVIETNNDHPLAEAFKLI